MTALVTMPDYKAKLERIFRLQLETFGGALVRRAGCEKPCSLQAHTFRPAVWGNPHHIGAHTWTWRGTG